MGLFGLFYALYMGGRWTTETVIRNSEDSRKSNEARIRGEQYYFASDGSKRSVLNNHKVIETKNNKGERILEDIELGRELYNYTQEKFQNKKQEAIDGGYTVYEKFVDRNILTQPDARYRDKLSMKYNKVFVDVETGQEFYVITIIHGCKRYSYESYYMDCKTGLLVRPTDEELFKNDCYIESNKDGKKNRAIMSKMDYVNTINKVNEIAKTPKAQICFQKDSFYDIELGGKFDTNYDATFDRERLRMIYCY